MITSRITSKAQTTIPQPVRTALALLYELHSQLGDELRTKSERAFAIRWGKLELLERVRQGADVEDLEKFIEADAEEFAQARSGYLLY